jgi:hypothetical protein
MQREKGRIEEVIPARRDSAISIFDLCFLILLVRGRIMAASLWQQRKDM